MKDRDRYVMSPESAKGPEDKKAKESAIGAYNASHDFADFAALNTDLEFVMNLPRISHKLWTVYDKKSLEETLAKIKKGNEEEMKELVDLTNRLQTK